MTMTMAAPQAGPSDLSEFAIAHRALRSGARLLADAVTAIAHGAACPQERHDAIVWFAEHVLHEAAEHHRKEDEILWPVIVASAGADVDLDELCDEHGVLDGILHRARNALRIFDTYGEVSAPTLAAALADLADDLDVHISRDEMLLFPVIRRYVSPRDFERIQARVAKDRPYAHLLFMVSWRTSVATPAERCTIAVPWQARFGRRRRQRRWEQRRALIAE